MGKKRVGVDQLFFRYLLILFFEKFLISVSFFKIMVVVLCVFSFPLLAFFFRIWNSDLSFYPTQLVGKSSSRKS